jgi:putative DNA primase/helicase
MKAASLTTALGGRWYTHYGLARCPAHEDRKPSLSITENSSGKLLVRCQAGCDQTEVIATLRARGLWETTGAPPSRATPTRSEVALAIWRSALPSRATLVETYLAARGLHIPLPPTLRFHPGLKHSSGDRFPAMVALVTQASGAGRSAPHISGPRRPGQSTG